MSYESGKVTAVVTGSVALGVPTGATMIDKSTTSTADADIYTVTAGKTLSIAAVSCSGAQSGAVGVNYVLEADDGTGTYVALAAFSYTGAASNMAATAMGYGLPYPVKVAATKKVRVHNYGGSTPANAHASIHGWEI